MSCAASSSDMGSTTNVVRRTTSRSSIGRGKYSARTAGRSPWRHWCPDGSPTQRRRFVRQSVPELVEPAPQPVREQVDSLTRLVRGDVGTHWRRSSSPSLAASRTRSTIRSTARRLTAYISDQNEITEAAHQDPQIWRTGRSTIESML